MYYIYRHVRKDTNMPFYIGKGTIDARKKSFVSRYFRAFDKLHRNDIWKKISNKTEYRVEIIFESNDEDFIFKKEIEFISIYGRISNRTGCLANLSEGGEGYSDRNKIVKRRRNIGKQYKIKFPSIHTEDFKKYMSDRMSGSNNPFYGRTGEKHPMYGREFPHELKRRYMVEYSKKIRVYKNGVLINTFECTNDCALYFNVTTSMIRSVIRNCSVGKYTSRGRFKDLILTNKDDKDDKD